MSRHIVIIGGDGAGMSAASQAKRRDPALRITAYEQGPVVSYSACSIPYYVGGLVDDPKRLIARTPEVFRDRLGIDVLTHHEVTGVDPNGQRVFVQQGSHAFWQEYDELVIATGATPMVPEWPGVRSQGIFPVKTLADGTRILEYIEAHHCQRAVVVGGGYIGLEMAENLRHLHLACTVVEQMGQVMPSMDSDMADLVASALDALGVVVALHEEVQGFEIENGRVHAVVTQNRTWPADLVILGLGVQPQNRLAAQAGIPLGTRGAIRVDPYLRTEVPHVWAVGDVTETHHLVTGKPTYIALATVANKQGRIAGINLGGGQVAFPGVLGTAITRVGTTEIARTGVTVHEAQGAGLTATETMIRAETKLDYFPDVSPIHIKLVADSSTGRILGGQIVGGPGSGKRIDTVATAITAGMTSAQLVDLDLAYAPPFSDVWDPVQIAARTLVSKA